MLSAKKKTGNLHHHNGRQAARLGSSVAMCMQGGRWTHAGLQTEGRHRCPGHARFVSELQGAHRASQSQAMEHVHDAVVAGQGLAPTTMQRHSWGTSMRTDSAATRWWSCCLDLLARASATVMRTIHSSRKMIRIDWQASFSANLQPQDPRCAVAAATCTTPQLGCHGKVRNVPHYNRA
jgi:hypothetical protein